MGSGGFLSPNLCNAKSIPTDWIKCLTDAGRLKGVFKNRPCACSSAQEPAEFSRIRGGRLSYFKVFKKKNRIFPQPINPEYISIDIPM